ncbi:peptide/nickel transport system ATP-binding protein [Labrenzia sp. MBR-25]
METNVAPALLEVTDLRTEFSSIDGVTTAVDGLSLRLGRGETLGIVGESGCGKSITSFSIMRLLPSFANIASGEILFQGRNLLDLNEREMRKIRGKDIAMIFQEPMTSLNPLITVGGQIAEVIRLHEGVGRSEAWRRAGEMLERVHVPDPFRRLDDFPHQFSGGMRQRAMIAIALACEPSLLIADEPTTALDVTIQAQILGLIGDLQKQTGTSVLLITHDLGVVAESCKRVMVMYAGRNVEEAEVSELFDAPAHPYTRALMKARPSAESRGHRLAEIPGRVPNMKEPIAGCAFAPRCPFSTERCRTERPLPRSIANPGHRVACHEAERVLSSEMEAA